MVVVQYVYDKVDNVVKKTNANGIVTVKTYDGNVLKTIDDKGNNIVYNCLNQPLTVIDSMGKSTVFKISYGDDWYELIGVNG